MAKKSQRAAAAQAAKDAKPAKLVKGYLSRDYHDRHSGKVYGPGTVEVPEDSTIATFFTDPPTEEK